jgi:hypothetical protein
VQQHIESLATASLHRFSDWPNREIPDVCAGVYTICDRNGEFLYVGMAGAGLSDEVIKKKRATGKRSGLADRLNSHASGYRSGDRFNIYIGDLYVLKTLSPDTIERISLGTTSFDGFIKTFIRDELSYRYVVVPNTAVRELELHIQTNGINGELPVINRRG